MPGGGRYRRCWAGAPTIAHEKAADQDARKPGFADAVRSARRLRIRERRGTAPCLPALACGRRTRIPAVPLRDSPPSSWRGNAWAIRSNGPRTIRAAPGCVNQALVSPDRHHRPGPGRRDPRCAPGPTGIRVGVRASNSSRCSASGPDAAPRPSTPTIRRWSGPRHARSVTPWRRRSPRSRPPAPFGPSASDSRSGTTWPPVYDKVDHVVLGPAGLFALESQDWGSEVRLVRGELVGDAVPPRAEPVRSLTRATRALAKELGVRFTAVLLVVPDGALAEPDHPGRPWSSRECPRDPAVPDAPAVA